MATYLTDFAITIEPIYDNLPPKVQVGIDHELSTLELLTTHTFIYSLDLAEGLHSISVSLVDKLNNDRTQAVKITRIEFEGISTSNMHYAGRYYPKYPQPWLSQQRVQPSACLQGCDYLGWNGTWQLEFTVPIFTWIHKLEHLGWIYHTAPLKLPSLAS
jgi:hypothetical protein